MITLYPILAISLGYLLVFLKDRKLIIRALFTAIVIFFIFLNQFQWWQLKHYILDPYRTTKEYYWATFLKTKVTEELTERKELLGTRTTVLARQEERMRSQLKELQTQLQQDLRPVGSPPPS